MRFLIASVLIVATIIAAGMLFTSFRQTSLKLNPTPLPTVISPLSPTPSEGLILTPILSPTLTMGEVSFEEKWVEVEGQDMIYFVPKNILPNQPLTLVIYSHGSTEKIGVSDNTNEVVAKLRNYAQNLTAQNFILAASSMHGENWGSSESIEDIGKVINFLGGEYSLSEKVDLWGFSMGGLPVMLYVEQNPSKVGKIALFAPSVDLDYWTAAKIEAIKNIPIKIWHGSIDQNVPYQSSQDFLQKLLAGGVQVEFKTMEGVGHFDLEDIKGLVEFLTK